jgi:hypothetical protein
MTTAMGPTVRPNRTDGLVWPAAEKVTAFYAGCDRYARSERITFWNNSRRLQVARPRVIAY